ALPDIRATVASWADTENECAWLVLPGREWSALQGSGCGPGAQTGCPGVAGAGEGCLGADPHRPLVGPVRRRGSGQRPGAERVVVEGVVVQVHDGYHGRPTGHAGQPAGPLLPDRRHVEPDQVVGEVSERAEVDAGDRRAISGHGREGAVDDPPV